LSNIKVPRRNHGNRYTLQVSQQCAVPPKKVTVVTLRLHRYRLQGGQLRVGSQDLTVIRPHVPITFPSGPGQEDKDTEKAVSILSKQLGKEAKHKKKEGRKRALFA
jgi:hypothetical protein